MADLEARIAALEADNRRLRRLLDQHGTPGELRHRLRNTVAMMRTIIRKSADDTRDIASYAAHLEDRLDALARSQAAIDETGTAEIPKLLIDELFSYGASEDERVSLSGPRVAFEPRPGLMVALAMHELAVNAIEHGALGTASGHIDIRWTVTGQDTVPRLTLIWKETGVAMGAPPTRQGFGTDVLTRMLGYELKAETSFAFEADGMRCTIQLPLPIEVGQVLPETPVTD